jgi:hypothetical protein
MVVGSELLFGLFPADAQGYPLPSGTVANLETWINDGRGGNAGTLISWPDTIVLSGGIGTPAPATLAIGDTSVFEGNRGRHKVTVYVSLSNASDQAISVDWRTVAGTALAKADYGAASGRLTFLPGETFKSITLTVKTDRVREPDETFTVELSNPVGTTIDDAVGVVTVLNDD